MNKRFRGILCLLMLLFALPACAQAAEITAQGSGSVSAEPDMVTVSLSASATAESMLHAQEQISAIVDRAVQSLLALGIMEEDVVTTSYGVYPEYNYDENPRALTGYRASHMLEVTCRDVTLLDSVITALTDSGVSEINDVSYGVSDRSGMYKQALALAVQAAREKAQTLAAAEGRTVTGLVSLTENQSYDTRYALVASAYKENAALDTGIRSGSISVSASVTAVYTAE